MTQVPHPIAIVQGAPSAVIQALFAELASEWRHTARIVGVIEHDAQAGGQCGAGQLFSLTDGARFSIFQDLGRGSDACNVDPAGALTAGEAVRRDIAAGCDLAVLSKFGKLEAEAKGGLFAAFVAAAEAGVPILTSVSPKFEPVWRQFTEGAYVTLAAERGAVAAWWAAVSAKRAEAAARS